MNSQNNTTAKTKNRKVISFLYAFILFLSFYASSYFVVLSMGAQRTFHVISLIFTFVWSAFFTSIALILPPLASKIFYGVVYMLLLIYGIAEYIYYNIFEKLFSFTVISNIKEGAGYVKDIFSFIGWWQIAVFLLFIILGVIVICLIDKISKPTLPIRIILVPVSLILVVIGQFVLPNAFGPMSEKATWNSFENPRYIYEKYIDPHKCLGMVGYQQYIWMDFHNCFIRPLIADTTKQRTQTDTFFSEYGKEHKDNELTGVFKGKNAIVVMLESVDWQAVANSNTPTINMMMNEGITFTNYYASVFGDGATFSNEFLLNTGVCAPSNGTAAYSYKDNSFPNSLPNLFKKEGYSAASFHHNHGWFYNRAIMHMNFGYESYNSYYDYGGKWEEVIVDTYLTETKELLQDVLNNNESPFLSFIITYSAHLGYTYDAELAQYAFDNYVDKNEVRPEKDDVNVLQAKARITDKMLKDLIENVDEDTVIICVTDHYAYGLKEETLNELYDTEWGLRQRVPFFIYCSDPDTPKLTLLLIRYVQIRIFYQPLQIYSVLNIRKM